MLRHLRIYELDDAYVAKGRSAGAGSWNERRCFVGDGEVATDGHAAISKQIFQGRFFEADCL